MSHLLRPASFEDYFMRQWLMVRGVWANRRCCRELRKPLMLEAEVLFLPSILKLFWVLEFIIERVHVF